MDAKKIAHYQRLDCYISGLLKDIYPEIPSEPHISITRLMIEKLSEYRSLKDLSVLDIGCGQGLALEHFSGKGCKVVGTTFGEDYRICRAKGFEVYEMDQSFLDFSAGEFDVIWCRHALEHSLFPLFTLAGFSDVLKNDGLIYIEVPAPSTSAHHEKNRNHYSCFTAPVWAAIFEKANLEIIAAYDHNFVVPCGPDTYHSFLLSKAAQ